MKKAASLFLLSIFLFNAVGYYFVYKAAQYQIKYEMQSEIKQGADNNEFETLTISKNNLHYVEWLETGKEMRYNNKLYDIVKCTETSSAVTFYCINDTKEESLFANLEEHINTHIAGKPTKNENQKKSIGNIIKLYFNNDLSINLNLVSSEKHIFSSNNFTYKSTLIETDSPPPELA